MKKLILLLIILTSFNLSISAQQINPPKGYDQNIGNLISMMDDLKGRIERSVSELSVVETDFLLDDKANRIGAMILHLAATEVYYQHYTFEGTGFQEGEELYELALGLGDKGRASEELQGKPISYYLEIWDKVRADSKAMLKKVDDEWLAKKIPGSNANRHWAWYHVMEHQANHMGQIRLILSRIN
jgi:hypothetical protein